MKWYKLNLFKLMVGANLFALLLDASRAFGKLYLKQTCTPWDVLMPCLIGMALLLVVVGQERSSLHYKEGYKWARGMIENYEQLVARMVKTMNAALEEKSNEGEDWKK